MHTRGQHLGMIYRICIQMSHINYMHHMYILYYTFRVISLRLYYEIWVVLQVVHFFSPQICNSLTSLTTLHHVRTTIKDGNCGA